jgi:hypothetical protein
MTDAAHALLHTAGAAAHGRLDTEIIALCAARTVLVSDPYMVAYDQSFLQRVGRGWAEDVQFVELRARARLPLEAAHVAELVATYAP